MSQSYSLSAECNLATYMCRHKCTRCGRRTGTPAAALSQAARQTLAATRLPRRRPCRRLLARRPRPPRCDAVCCCAPHGAVWNTLLTRHICEDFATAAASCPRRCGSAMYMRDRFEFADGCCCRRHRHVGHQKMKAVCAASARSSARRRASSTLARYTSAHAASVQRSGSARTASVQSARSAQKCLSMCSAEFAQLCACAMVRTGLIMLADASAPCVSHKSDTIH